MLYGTCAIRRARVRQLVVRAQSGTKLLLLLFFFLP